MVKIARDNLALALECDNEVNLLREKLRSLEGLEADYFLSEKVCPVESKLTNFKFERK
jgi:hypothetical protein